MVTLAVTVQTRKDVDTALDEGADLTERGSGNDVRARVAGEYCGG